MYCNTHNYIAADRLSDFYIRVGNSFNQESFDPATYTQCCYQSDAFEQGGTKQFNCTSGIVGRYVAIHFPTTKTQDLTLCEVQVYAVEGKKNK